MSKKSSKSFKVNKVINLVVPLSSGIESLNQARIEEIRASHSEVRALRSEYVRVQAALDLARQRYEVAAHGISPALRSAIVREQG